MPARAVKPRDQSVWDIYPKGLILPWQTSEQSIPASMKGVWDFLENVDNKAAEQLSGTGLFLCGFSGKSSKIAEHSGGKATHSHHAVAKNLGEGDGRGFESEGDHVTFGHTEEVEHMPPYISVRLIIKIK